MTPASTANNPPLLPVRLKSAVVMKRRAALVGLYFFTAMLLLEVVHAAERNFLPGREGDDGFFPVRLAAAGALAAAGEVLLLAADVDRVDLHDRHAEDFGDGVLDLVVANSGSNDVSVLLSQGTGTNWTRTGFA